MQYIPMTAEQYYIVKDRLSTQEKICGCLACRMHGVA